MPAADVHTLIGAYALDALEDDDRLAFDEHLAGCEACRDDIVGLRRTAIRLAGGAAVPPPQQLREDVLERVGVTAQVRDGRPRAEAAPHSLPEARPRSRLLLAAAAVLAVLSIGAGALSWSQYRSAHEATATAEAISAVLADPAARVVDARAGAQGTVRLLVANGRAVLAVQALPPLPQDRTYQLWVIHGQQITSAGLGPAGSSADGTWSRLVDDVQPGNVVAISVEPRGGSDRPTTSPVVGLQV